MKVSFFLALTVGLLFTSGLFSVLLYGKLTGKPWANIGRQPDSPIVFADNPGAGEKPDSVAPARVQEQPSKKSAAMLQAPVFKQYPELRAGCELTSLAMLLNYYGIEKSKMDLVPEMEKDETPIRWAEDGTIAYWGNPNIGFVGDITGKSKGFGIYHGPLLKLLQKYVPSGIDLTGKPFDEIEQQVSDGFPVIVWTTVDFSVPERWVVWDTPIGPIRTTFAEHAVLLVGYDENNVYVNDPLSGKANYPIDKEQFIATWEAMGRQAISYSEHNEQNESKPIR